MINKIKKLLLVATLPLLALCHTAPAQAATVIEVPVEWCDLLESIAFEVDWCNPEITVGTPTNPTTDAVSIQVETDRGGSGTMYAYPTTSCSTAPSIDQIKIDGQKFFVVADEINTTISGLTPGTTNYCVWYSHEWERRFSTPVKSALFDTESVSGDPIEGYFVKNGDGCSDSNTGLSDAQAWCSLNKAKTTVSTTSAKINLKAGSRWVEAFSMPVGGTASDFAELRCYKMVAGVESLCDETEYGTDFTTNTLPKIAGDLTDTCIAARNCNYSASSPVGEWGSQLSISLKNYVRVSYIQVEYGRRFGISFSGQLSPTVTIQSPEIHHVRVYRVGVTPFVFGPSVKNPYGHTFESKETGLCAAQRKKNGPIFPGTHCSDTTFTWGVGIEIVRSNDTDGLMTNFKILSHFGEGVSCYVGGGMVWRDFIASNMYSAGLYSDSGSDCVYENFLVIGPNKFAGAYSYGDVWGGAPSVFIEDISKSWGTGARRNIFRNGTVINAGSGFTLGQDPASATDGQKLGAKLFHLNIIHPMRSGIQASWGGTNATVEDFELVNSIIWNVDSADETCYLSFTKGVFQNNMWFGKIPITGCRGTGYMNANPKFVQDDYLVYNDYKYTNLPTEESLYLQATSPAIHAGTDRLLTEVCIDKTKHAFALSKMNVDPDKWAKCALLDFYGEERVAGQVNLGPFKGNN